MKISVVVTIVVTSPGSQLFYLTSSGNQPYKVHYQNGSNACFILPQSMGSKEHNLGSK